MPNYTNLQQGRTMQQIEAKSGHQRREAIAAAILHRALPSAHSLPAGHPGSDWAYSTLPEIARHCLHSAGVSTAGMSSADVAVKALSTSDLPSILANVANKSLRLGYELSPRTFLPLANRSDLPDFKEVSRAQLSDAPKLERVLEGGEYSYGSIVDAGEKWQLFKYGKIINVNWEAIVNDDLGAFTRIPQAMGMAAHSLESDLFWSHLTDNPAMADGEQLFSVPHRNLSEDPGTINIASMSAGRAAMRQQRGLNQQIINISPAYLVVPCSLETRAEQFVAQSLQPAESIAVNPFGGQLQVVTDPRLDEASETAWYMWANPAVVDTIAYGYLAGESGPVIELKNSFDRDAVEMKVRHNFGVKAIDWRGLYLNPGE